MELMRAAHVHVSHVPFDQGHSLPGQTTQTPKERPGRKSEGPPRDKGLQCPLILHLFKSTGNRSNKIRLALESQPCWLSSACLISGRWHAVGGGGSNDSSQLQKAPPTAAVAAHTVGSTVSAERAISGSRAARQPQASFPPPTTDSSRGTRSCGCLPLAATQVARRPGEFLAAYGSFSRSILSGPGAGSGGGGAVDGSAASRAALCARSSVDGRNPGTGSFERGNAWVGGTFRLLGVNRPAGCHAIS